MPSLRYTEEHNVLLNLTARGRINDPELADTGVLVDNSGGYSIGASSTIVVDTVDATTKYVVGDIVINQVNSEVGRISSLTSTSITLTSTNKFALADNENLKIATNTKQWLTNRIALKAETISIASSKQVMSFPLPFSGVAIGESQAVSVDMGMTSKTLSMSGIITEQTIYKKFTDNSTVTTVTMCAHEVAQLLHSYVDSSFWQDHQNFNSLIVLIPTRVNKNWEYHAPIDETADIGDLPLMPFTFAVRDKDTEGTIQRGRSEWPPIVDETSVDVSAMSGFIRNFNTTFTAGMPFVEFSLDFEVALSPMAGLKDILSGD